MCGVELLGTNVIGPHFFEGNLNGEMYLHFLRNILPELLEDVELDVRQVLWFQHDGAPPHYHRRVRNYLPRAFGRRVIAREAECAWPARSPDLTPLDFFFWGKVKNEVYSVPIENERHLRERITESCRSVTPEMLARVRGSFQRRIDICQEREGRQFEHLL